MEKRGASTGAFIAAIKEELRARSMSQKALASNLGVDPSTLSLWITGRQCPRLDDSGIIKKLSEFLRKKPDYVKTLLAAQKQGKNVESKSSQPRMISKYGELQAVLTEKLPFFFDQSIPLNASIGVTSILERLEERGFSVPEKLLVQAIDAWIGKNPTRKWILDKTAVGRSEEADQKFAFENLEGEALLAYFKKHFRDQQWIRDTIRQVCNLIENAFIASSTRELEKREILDLIGECLPDSENKAPLKNAIFQSLESTKLIKPSGNDSYRQHWPINSEFILNSVFGIQALIPRLDFLLDGGLRPAAGAGLAMLIQGKAGAGKTMLALQLAANAASQGHVGIYLTAEEDISHLIEKLSYMGYSQTCFQDNRTVLVDNRQHRKFCLMTTPVNSSEMKFSEELLLDGNLGTLILLSIPNRSMFSRSTILKQVHSLLGSLSQNNIYTFCVLDSVDSVLESRERKFYEALFNEFRTAKSIGIFISEESSDESVSLRRYMADIVVRVGYRSRLPGYKERFIEIEKARNQSHLRGQHMFAIHSRSGIIVYPAVQAILSIWRRRVRHEFVHEQEEWRLDENFDLSKILRGDVVKGSSVLISGPPATHKIPIGLSFLASELLSKQDTQVLLISLREDSASFVRILQTYPQLSVMLSRRNQRTILSPRVRILHFPPDYFSADRFLHWIRRAVDDICPSRILFSSLNQLPHNSPMFKLEPLFVDVLIELFRKKQITSLFTDVATAKNTGIHNIFDTIIFTSKPGSKNDPDRVVLNVSHSGPCNADRTPKEIRRVATGSSGILTLMDYSGDPVI